MSSNSNIMECGSHCQCVKQTRQSMAKILTNRSNNVAASLQICVSIYDKHEKFG